MVTAASITLQLAVLIYFYLTLYFSVLTIMYFYYILTFVFLFSAGV